MVQQKNYSITVLVAVEDFDMWKESEDYQKLYVQLTQLIGKQELFIDSMDCRGRTNKKLKLIESHVP